MNRRRNPLIRSFLDLKGNSRACMYTEPLWAIPFNLYQPFVSVYMAALLLTDWQIGFVASIGMFIRTLSALLSGAITDKLGRRLTTAIFDICSWSIPCLLWAFSQNFWWFIAAAAFNGLMQVTDNSWICLLVEDAERGALVRIFSLIHMVAQLSVIFAPFAALLVGRLTIVPAMRIMYMFSFVSMTTKFILLYFYSGETQIGVIRKKETAGMTIWQIMGGYGQIYKRIFTSPEMVLAMALAAMFNIVGVISGNFFSLYTTGTLGVPERYLAYFPILRSLVIAGFLFIIQPGLERFGFRRPMLTGLVIYLANNLLLICTPKDTLWILFVYTFLEAFSYSLVMPRSDSLTALLIEPSERARIKGLITVIVLSCGVPFGYIAGRLSEMDRRLPFVLNMAIFTLALIIIAKNKKKLDGIPTAPAPSTASTPQARV